MKKEIFSTFLLIFIVFGAGCVSNTSDPNVLWLPSGEGKTSLDLSGGDASISKYNQAMENKNIQTCQLISNTDLKQQCIAYLSGNFDYCKTLINDTESALSTKYFEHDRCIVMIAMISDIEPGKIQFCDSVYDINYKTECKAIILRSAQTCDSLLRDLDKSNCLLSVVEKTEDLSICESYDFSKFEEPQEERDRCYLKVASRKHDKSICNKITSDITRDICIYNN